LWTHLNTIWNEQATTAGRIFHLRENAIVTMFTSIF
jgi:hypothetical protein